MIRETSEAANGAQPQVFISYGRPDAEQVLTIARLLEAEGATVWRDGDRILGGQYYGEEIMHAIAHSRVVMLMCSPHSFQSDNVHREVLLTWEYAHRRYVPVWLSPPIEIPPRFRYCLAGCQWIDAHSQPQEQWLPQLLKAFQALGIDTNSKLVPAVEATPAPGFENTPRALRFRPGDRPIRGADWELEQLLGKGGFGEVWKAHNPELPGFAPVALKFCTQLDDRSKGLLRHEADMVLRAQRQIRSDGFVPLLHAYLNNDPPCLEYPYIEGGTLVRLIDQCRQSGVLLEPAQAQRLVQRVAQIVSAAHRATPTLVHRDLKPSNILAERRKDGKIVLRVTDFGIGGVVAHPVLDRSRSSSMAENMASVLTGSYSPLYASPQQMRGDKPDPRDDVYALGVIWYQLLTADLSSPAPAGRRWVDDLRKRGMTDVGIDVLSSCVEGSPTHRPDDAGKLFELLQSLAPSASAKSGESKRETHVADAKPSLAESGEGEPPGEPNAKSIKVELRPAGEPNDMPAGTEPRPPKIADGHRVSPVPRDERAKTPGTFGHFGQTGGVRRWVAAGALGLVGMLGVILYVATDNGTVKITGTDPMMKVLIDGQEVRIENVGKPITIRTGPHELFVTRDGLEVKTSTFLIRRGEERVLEVTHTPIAPPVVRDDPTPPKPVVAASPAREPVAGPKAAAKAVSSAPDPIAGPKAAAKAVSPTPAPHDPEYITTRTGQIKLRLIPAGAFLMGSPADDKDADDDEKPQHPVRITRSFYLGFYEVTQAQYEAVMDKTPSYFSASDEGKEKVAGQSTDRHPVENVSWVDAVQFCNKLSDKEGLKRFYEIDGESVRVADWSQPGYRLPTEAEWEYACRANAPTRYSFGDDATSLGEFAWYDRNSGSKTHPVGEKRPNGFSLFDMHGNVLEWCWDGYDAYKASRVDDPTGLDGSALRVIRGGSWYNDARLVRAAYRNFRGPSYRNSVVGFRCARVQSGR